MKTNQDLIKSFREEFDKNKCYCKCHRTFNLKGNLGHCLRCGERIRLQREDYLLSLYQNHIREWLEGMKKPKRESKSLSELTYQNGNFKAAEIVLKEEGYNQALSDVIEKLSK